MTYNGAASDAFAIQVVAAAPGITTYNGSGVAQHALTGALVTHEAPAEPGEVIVLWGTGLGATTDSDTTYTSTPHQTDLPYKVYVGGVSASVAYAGRSVYPGVSVFRSNGTSEYAHRLLRTGCGRYRPHRKQHGVNPDRLEWATVLHISASDSL